jgi:demethylmenaquinone methyltransferase/2-methoxy-6-polyprenyl-1,4-benzoquinol methylase
MSPPHTEKPGDRRAHSPRIGALGPRSFDATRFDASPEPGRVLNMFDRIAGSYDRMNQVMTAGLHHRWRELAVMVARVGSGCTALDVCCGTGDLAFELRRAIGAEGTVVGVDISEEMLDVARDKCGRNQLYVDFRRADVLALPFPDGRPDDGEPAAQEAAAGGRRAGPGAVPGAGPAGFDACTAGFGIRNVPDIVGAFSEMRRVCRPGGRVVCLEITQPGIPVFKQFYALWFRRVVPVLGRIASRDETAYTYLPASVLRFPRPDELKTLMEQAGLRNVRYEILAGGIIALHHGIA